MERSKLYRNCRFKVETLLSAFEKLNDKKILNKKLEVQHKDESTWRYDDVEEFLADYRTSKLNADFAIWYEEEIMLGVTSTVADVRVHMEHKNRGTILQIFNIFEESYENSRFPEPPKEKKIISKPVVFIGHGRSNAWRDLKDHLQDQHGIKVEAYETGSRVGHTIRDILENMMSKSNFAILVLTAEDLQADEKYRARQNVIHETGLFQGKLGFSRVILLKEKNTELFSNVDGIQYISFSEGNIKETFGDVLATLKREFY